MPSSCASCAIALLTFLRRRKVRAEEDIDAFFHLTDGVTTAAASNAPPRLRTPSRALTKEERAMIYYRYYLDLTVREIAAETGKSKSAVGAAGHRGGGKAERAAFRGTNGGLNAL